MKDKKRKRISTACNQQINQMATIASYGLGWVKPNTDPDEIGYRLGGIETVAHQISCFLYQSFKIEYDTGETRDVLNLSKFPSAEQIEAKLVEIIENEINSK